MRKTAGFALAATLLLGFAPHAMAAGCDAILPTPETVAASKRAITADDLVRLRDIGNEYTPDPGESLLVLSPDKSHVAFVLHRGDPESNAYCEALIAIDLASDATPRLVDTGDTLIRRDMNVRGGQQETGVPKDNKPAWSPDGKHIAYLKRVDGVTQVWHGGIDGAGGKLMRAPIDIENVAWSPTGDALIVATKPGAAEALQAIEREGRHGYVYDERIFPGTTTSRPLIPGNRPIVYSAIDTETGTSRPATEQEKALLVPAHDDVSLEHALFTSVAADGRRAWTAPRDPKNFMTTVELWAEDAKGAKVRCEVSAACDSSSMYRIDGPWWWNGDVYFLHREGWSQSALALYRWTPGAGEPQRLVTTNDKLSGCLLVDGKLLCLRDASTEPRRIVTLDLATGASRTLFDPNPEFASIAFGKVERLHWRNKLGLECFGDLVLPPGFQQGQKVPLVVVQYRTRGFLRGGTGDEYPIHLLAARGYAVLSLDLPPLYFTAQKGKSYASYYDAWKDNARNFNEQRNQHSSLMAGINQAVGRGVVDPKKIALTGLSAGSMSVRYALVNNPPGTFAAAIISTCCFEGSSMFWSGGPAAGKEKVDMGYPRPIEKEIGRWKEAALLPNAKTLDVPLLMQVADDELIQGLDTFTTLRMYRQPTELIIYPGEHHIKWQPAHRMALYTRNLDWFDFWVMGKEDRDPAKAAQYERWRKLRAERDAAAGKSHQSRS